MKIENFKEILTINDQHKHEIEEVAYRDRMEILPGSLSTSLIFVAIGEYTKIIKINMPTDKFGAMVFKIDDRYYLIVNSSQPKSMQHFYVLHELYHILHEPSDTFKIIDGILVENNNESDFAEDLNGTQYKDDLVERKASLYASIMLVPADELKRVFYQFSEKMRIEQLLVELSNFFNAPLTLILLRLFETDIILRDEIDDFKKLIELDEIDVKKLFLEYGVETTSLIKTNECNIELLAKQLEEDDFINEVNYPEDIQDTMAEIVRIALLLREGGNNDSM